MYKESELVKIAKRENNNKRNYLVINRFQAKHIPTVPSNALKLFDCLANKIKGTIDCKKTLFIGFAETATAIGARTAVNLGGFYMQTTREDIENAEYLFFTESHSHASEQRLVKTDLDIIAEKIDNIVFVEDEITTGNTILKIVNIIRKTYPQKQIHFFAASLLNGMNEEAIERYKENDISTKYLVKTNHEPYIGLAEKYDCDGEYIKTYSTNSESVNYHTVGGWVNGRRAVKAEEYNQACKELANEIIKKINIQKGQTVLVIGTEEFMYPAIYTAYILEKNGFNVKCHSTTRSPIAVSSNPDYPLHCRYELDSLYENGRRTFIYDLQKYDRAVVITDSDLKKNGTENLIGALQHSGNENIDIIRWC